MSKFFLARRFSRLLSLALLAGIFQISFAHADDQNQRRRRLQQQQQQEQQQPVQRQPLFTRPNVFAPQRFPAQQQPVQQPRTFTPFQPPQSRTAVNPNAPIYQPSTGNPNAQVARPFVNPNAQGDRAVSNPNAQASFPSRQNQFRPNPSGQPVEPNRVFTPSSQQGRFIGVPSASSQTAPSSVAAISSAQNGNGQGSLTRRDVLSSPEDRDFLRGLTAQQRKQLDQLSPEQIQSLQQNGQWAATKQAILTGRSSSQGAQSTVANPNTQSPSAVPSTSVQNSTVASSAGPQNSSSSSASGPSNTSGMSLNDMGPASTMDAGAAASTNSVQVPTAPPPLAPSTLQIVGFPQSFNASGGGSYQPSISLSGSGFTTMTQIVWTCFMPNGQPCTGNPYKWSPSDWSGKYTVQSDRSATVAPHLLAGGDPTGIYQWTVSFVGNGGISFSFQVNNGGAPSPMPPPASIPTTPQPPVTPPPVANNVPVVPQPPSATASSSASSNSPSQTVAVSQLRVAGIAPVYSSSGSALRPVISLGGNDSIPSPRSLGPATCPTDSHAATSPTHGRLLTGADAL